MFCRAADAHHNFQLSHDMGCLREYEFDKFWPIARHLHSLMVEDVDCNGNDILRHPHTPTEFADRVYQTI
jgi:hypothetical protein